MWWSRRLLQSDIADHEWSRGENEGVGLNLAQRASFNRARGFILRRRLLEAGGHVEEGAEDVGINEGEVTGVGVKDGAVGVELVD